MYVWPGFTIPAGWSIMLVPSALQLCPNAFKDPLEFNPWRWKVSEFHNFMNIYIYIYICIYYFFQIFIAINYKVGLMATNYKLLVK